MEERGHRRSWYHLYVFRQTGLTSTRKSRKLQRKGGSAEVRWVRVWRAACQRREGRTRELITDGATGHETATTCMEFWKHPKKPLSALLGQLLDDIQDPMWSHFGLVTDYRAGSLYSHIGGTNWDCSTDCFISLVPALFHTATDGWLLPPLYQLQVIHKLLRTTGVAFRYVLLTSNWRFHLAGAWKPLISTLFHNSHAHMVDTLHFLLASHKTLSAIWIAATNSEAAAAF